MKSFKEYLKESTEKPFFDDGKDIAAFEYISPRERNLTPEEAKIRDVSYALKMASEESTNYAAPIMAQFVDHNSILIPIPSSKGDTRSNNALAKKIAKITNGSVIDVLIRTKDVPSSAELRHAGRPGIKPEEHQFIIKDEFREFINKTNKKIYLVDNVITTGATINAARKSLAKSNIKSIVFAKAKEL